ncbi:hypothetical protein SAMN05216296_0895 [Pseudomonas pohangensis]|uniref:Uncharacterized protein n=1 Tax=Pseudomonas pohangensis TaxID=364197 RepID=A0A1H2ELC5_9PSED|nr:hypothetical protein [Pseudomonas pohangensis]SDT95972.1 hypothetical protein SAMN05216296_0895 [Pseudomonas pohangensis]
MSAVLESSRTGLGQRLMRRRISALLAGLLAIGLLLFGGRLLLAGIADYQAEAFLDAWETTANEPDARAWDIAHAAAQRAINLYPVADGERLDRLGRIYSWKQFRQPFAAPAAQASRQAALDAYRASVSARPTWPDSWARLAHAKLYLQQFDDEFAHALTQAFALGPWRIAVNRELVQVGLIAWPHLSTDQRQATLESARRVAAFSPVEAQQLLQLAGQTGTLQQVCGVLDSEKPAVECQH